MLGMHDTPPHRSSTAARRPQRSRDADIAEALSAQLSELSVSAPGSPLLFGQDPMSTSSPSHSPAPTTMSLRSDGLQLQQTGQRAVYNITINANSVSLKFNAGSAPDPATAPAHSGRAPRHRSRQSREVAPQAPAVTPLPPRDGRAPPQPDVAVASSSPSSSSAARARARALGQRFSERIPWDPSLEHRDPFDERHRGKCFKSYHDAEAYYEQMKAEGYVWLLRV